jgi:hypothetical protein
MDFWHVTIILVEIHLLARNFSQVAYSTSPGLPDTSQTRGIMHIMFIGKLCRFVCTSQETHYISATSPTG